jgi:hypothetical protein
MIGGYAPKCPTLMFGVSSVTMSTSNFYLVRVAIETSSNLGNIYLPPVDQPAESAAGSSS